MNDGRRKLAFMFMGPKYDPEKHWVKFELETHDTYVFTARNFDEALDRAKRMAEDGFGALEVCSAFSKEQVRALIDATENKMVIGFVEHLPEQDDLFNTFFRKKK